MRRIGKSAEKPIYQFMTDEELQVIIPFGYELRNKSRFKEISNFMVDPSHYGTEKGQYDTGKNTEHFFS
jgi:hypothetical protein